MKDAEPPPSFYAYLLRAAPLVSAIAGCLSATFAAISIYYLVFINTQAQRIGDELGINRSIITSPQDDQIVGLTGIVQGRTPFTDRNIYLEVTDIPTGTHYVQHDYIHPGPDGAWKHSAVFGEASNCGVQFVIRIFVTRRSVEPGILSSYPPDVLFSSPITVRRAAC